MRGFEGTGASTAMVVACTIAAACGSPSRVGETPKWTEATTNEPVAKAPACIPRIEEDTRIVSATATGELVQYCIGTERPECFSYDVSNKRLAKLTERPSPQTGSSAYVLTVNPALDVCASDSCKSLAPKVLPNVASIRAATNAAGSIAVFLLGDAPAGKGYAEIWDVAAQKRLTTFKYARGEFKCGDVAMLGDTIYVAASTCKQPAARGTLYTAKGRKIANVGGADFGVHGSAHVQIDNSLWAFLEENATQLAIQDVVKGKVKKTIALEPLFQAAGASMGDPGESALLKLGNGKLVVITGAPSAGSIGLVDIETGSIEVVRPPSC